ncbi:hypothetical protein [Aureimonas altamirensis]|uniref:hypothetical protein n=1 Tax=Aureimonas altamirensis TaxID=370622 RepID=UPI00068A9A92|nr:hypothetical protein [Aureimonas altamirensis]
MDWLSDLIERFVVDPDDRALAAVRLRTSQGRGASAAEAYLQLCRLVGESAVDTQGLMKALSGFERAGTLDRVGSLVIASFAAVRAAYPTRPEAQAARSALADFADAVIDDAGAQFGSSVHQWLVRLVGEAIVQVSTIAANRAPLVRVETGLSLPSSLLAYDLYEQPERGAELVERSRTSTPLLMPVTFEAVAP